MGKTGVELRYYKGFEFANMTGTQKSEILAWREKHEQENPSARRGKRSYEAMPHQDDKSTISALQSQLTELQNEVKRNKSISFEVNTTPSTNATNKEM